MLAQTLMSVFSRKRVNGNGPPTLWIELELIQSHMAQKPVLQGEVGCACIARGVSVERGNALVDQKAIAIESIAKYQ